MNVTIHIRLNAEQVVDGEPGDPVSCPVALALDTASTEIGGWWEVTSEFLIWHNPDQFAGKWSFPTPWRVAKWVKNFDSHNGIDRKGWKLRLFGTRFPELRFTLNLNNEEGLAAHWTPERLAVREAEITLAAANRRARA